MILPVVEVIDFEPALTVVVATRARMRDDPYSGPVFLTMFAKSGEEKIRSVFFCFKMVF